MVSQNTNKGLKELNYYNCGYYLLHRIIFKVLFLEPVGTTYSRLAVPAIDVCVCMCVCVCVCVCVRVCLCLKASVCEQALINIPFARPPVQTVRHRKQK